VHVLNTKNKVQKALLRHAIYCLCYRLDIVYNIDKWECRKK
jgi:hypothetical protein